VTTQDTEQDLSPLMHEALNWVIHLTSGSATQADARAFDAWKTQGPDHAHAFREAAALRSTIRAMPLGAAAREASNVMPFARTNGKSAGINRRTMLIGGGGAIAASAAAVLALPAPFDLWPSFAELNAGERTGVGERRTLHGMRGVTVEMNARTAMTLDANRGDAHLVAGEAYASVAPDARALMVSAGKERWLIHGATANIRVNDRETCITCLSGELVRADQSVTLREGQQYVAGADATPRISASDPSRSGSWRRGVLLFRQTPLSDVIEDINRYRNGTIILAGDGLSERLVSGIFHTDKIDNAPRQLQQLLGLSVTELPGKVIVFT
jgi:transmembrane sensor